MKLKKRTRKIIKSIIICSTIIALLLPVVANFLPRTQGSSVVDPNLLRAYIDSENVEIKEEENLIEMPDIEGTYQVVDVPKGNIITVMWGDEEKDVKLIGVKEVSSSKTVLEKHVKNDFVQLEFDEEDKDEDGNLLAYAYASDGTFINYNLILHGNAKVETNVSKNSKYDSELEAAQVLAINNRVGCWTEKDVKE